MSDEQEGLYNSTIFKRNQFSVSQFLAKVNLTTIAFFYRNSEQLTQQKANWARETLTYTE